MPEVERIKEAIRGEALGGWFFSSMHRRDAVSERILGLDPARVETRPWYYVVFSAGDPLKLCTPVEAHALDGLPGERLVYSSREHLISLLGSSLAPRLRGAKLACQFSDNLPVISYLDHGTARMLEALSIRLESSASLIQRLCGLLDASAMESHDRAARHLHEIVQLLWKRVRDSMHAGLPVFEGELQQAILDEFGRRGMICDHPPIVACGANSGDPHYAVRERGSRLSGGQVLQIDLWAKEATRGAVYADISWVGYLGSRPPERIAGVFDDLVRARDLVVETCRRRVDEGRDVRGSELDLLARSFLIERGHESGLRHRTGHSIDVDVHGAGVNLDGVEFPDDRLVLEGSCFSVEPGLYFDDFGLRTELDVCIRGGSARVSGPGPQYELLAL